MTMFWIVAAFFTIAALLFVLPPLLTQHRADTKKNPPLPDELNVSVYKDQFAELQADLDAGLISAEQYEQSRHELERRLMHDVADGTIEADHAKTVVKRGRWAAAVIALVLPLAAVGLYTRFGNPDAIAPEPRSASATGHPQSNADITRMAEDLAAKLEQNPDDGDGWVLLGRSYMALGRFKDAAEVFAKAEQLVQPDAQLLADFADALAMSDGRGNLGGRPLKLIRQALELDPNNQKALWLAGTAAYETGNYKAALITWQRLEKLLPPGSETAQTIAGNIREVQALVSGGSAADTADSGSAFQASAGDLGTKPAAAAAHVSGTLRLAAGNNFNADPGDAVFLFARAAQGPPMPLAVLRVKVKDLPLTFTLDDSMAVMPVRKLSDVDTVVVGARISKSGSATPQSGDLEGFSAPVAVGSNGVEVVIDHLVP